MGTYMKKILYVTVMTAITLLLLGGCCREDIRQNKESAGTNTIWLQTLEIYSAAANPDHIYHVAYPYGYYAITSDRDGSRATRRFDLTAHISTAELAQEEGSFQYFIEYVKGLPEDQEGKELSYCIRCRYTDEEGKEENIYRRGYDTFPEGWDGFMEQYNRICGGEYLSVGDQIQTVTPEFLTEAFGVTDADVREGVLQDVIDTQMLDMVKVSGLFQIRDALTGYYASVKEPLIEPHRPRELISVESTQEEYDAFLASFFARLNGCVVEEVDSDQDYLRYFYLPDTGTHFYTAQTGDLDDLPTRKGNGDTYFLQLDAHMEGMSMGVDFIYSADDRFILVPIDCGTDVMTAFCE